jgi:hypothetical protein
VRVYIVHFNHGRACVAELQWLVRAETGYQLQPTSTYGHIDEFLSCLIIEALVL